MSGLDKDDSANSTMEQITEFMCLLHKQEMANGTLKKMLLNNVRAEAGQRSS